MKIPKSALKNLVIDPYMLPSISEGEFALRVAEQFKNTKEEREIVQLIAGLMVSFYGLGFHEGLHEAADRLTKVIKFGVKG